MIISVTAFSAVADAADARIGIRAETPSIDPHFSYAAPNKAAISNIFESLVVRDKDLKVVSLLATEWSKPAEDVWEFKLRPNVHWHDGAPFTADDVLFTLERAGTVPNSPAPFGQFLQQIASVEAVDDLTVRITTKNGSTQLLMDLSEIPIVSRHAGEGAATEDYNSGKAAVGTGPFKFASWAPGSALALVRNDDYWGNASQFASVDIIPIPSDAGRVAALLAGDVDLIDAVPPDSYERLKTDSQIAVWAVPDVYCAYLHIDSDRGVSPMITAKDGSPIPNPLKDARVRHALALAIDRDAIIDRLMFGLGQKASQLISPSMLGYNPDIEMTPYDPEQAKALLAEAGYPDGFRMTIAGPNDRYVADGQITQAVAQMFERIGISMEVETMPSNVFMPKASAQDFSIFFIAFGTAQGTGWSALRAVLMTYDAENGYGPSNRGRYSNPLVDELTIKSLSAGTLEDASRYASEAAAVAYGEYGIIPLHYQMNVWAARKGFTYEARQDSLTLAYGLSKAE